MTCQVEHSLTAFKLIGNKLEWLDQWHVEVVKDSDEFGWQYSLDFHSKF
jgi:hypothetical protein